MADDRPAILLFYHYTPLTPTAESDWHRSVCERLSLCGRLRVSPEGLNGTLSGSLSALQGYVAACVAHVPSADRIDWKISSARADQLFAELNVRVVAEVVSLGVPFPGEHLTGEHLAPTDFHQLLRGAVEPESEPSAPVSPGKVVLLDTRNSYEWQIGRFELPGVQTLLPPIRQFSELPHWIDEQLPDLRGCTVLMYCTGGVRCEGASAYLRSRVEGQGPGAVYQLRGGIERYLEAYPDGGFFRGRNLLFDKRLSHAPEGAEVIGRCMRCTAPADSYALQPRCHTCRLLLLVCDGCVSRTSASALRCHQCEGASPLGDCKLGDCKLGDASPSLNAANTLGGHPTGAAAATTTTEPTGVATVGAAGDTPPASPLRVLCLHGFRQNASGMRGRCSQLQRKLKRIVQVRTRCAHRAHCVRSSDPVIR